MIPASPDSSDPIQSTEEIDHLERSTKKIKSDQVGQSESVAMEEGLPNFSAETPKEIVMETSSELAPITSFPHSQEDLQPKSFKAALLREQTQDDLDKRSRVFDDSDSEDDMESEEPIQTVSRIRIDFSKEHLKRIRSNWKGCLTVKLLGRNIDFKVLMDRVTKLWNLEGLFTPMDVGLGFYIIRFESKADYHKVYTGGPWIIQDHYLTVQKWYSDFRADKAQAMKTAIWLRFPLLPAEYYDEDTLLQIAAKLGNPLKLDNKTEKSVRGSYARMCIEMDLSKPLEPSIAVGKYDYHLEYEHIHTICFSRGRAGHRKDSCAISTTPKNSAGGSSVSINTDNVDNDKQRVYFNGQVKPSGPQDIGYGEWMVVSRKKRGLIGLLGRPMQELNNLLTKANNLHQGLWVEPWSRNFLLRHKIPHWIKTNPVLRAKIIRPRFLLIEWKLPPLLTPLEGQEVFGSCGTQTE